MELARVEEGCPNSENDMSETNEGGSNTASLLVVMLSLVFVAIFGYALIGGVVSGDPTNGFFIAIIVASALAIVVSAGVLVRYIYTKRARENNSNDDRYLSKDRGTFSGSDEENPQEEENIPRQTDSYEITEEDKTIMEIQARSVMGDVSALSPSSFGEDSLTTYHHHIIRDHKKKERQGFDFTRITPAEKTERVRPRQDPPEGVGVANFQAAWDTRGNSQDPSAPKLSTEGDVLAEEEQPGSNIKTPKSPAARLTSALRPKSPANSVAKSLPPSILKKKGKKTDAPKRPSSTRSVPAFMNKSVPDTPGAASVASTFFGMFGKNKKAASEVGASVPIELNVKKESNDKSETKSNEGKPPVKKPNGAKPPMVRPPMLPPSNKLAEEKLKTIGGRSIPSTPGDKSTFTIPPPRPIPRTPMGSEVFSEYQSAVGSTTPSSTFDPVAHQRALDKLRESEANIGARPAMPIYYNDDEDDDDDVVVDDNANESSVPAESIALSYDVFAPPGALGIVVDSTDKGCVVYSLKKTSPMRGLMNKGDLIIGLDNFDVRNMDAAALTKLMAKKAQQTERKFTLMPSSS